LFLHICRIVWIVYHFDEWMSRDRANMQIRFSTNYIPYQNGRHDLHVMCLEKVSIVLNHDYMVEE